MERTPYTQLNTAEPSQPVTNETANPILSIDGVPIDLLRYFSVEPKELNVDDRKKLDDISSWVPRDSSMGDFLLRLKSIENRLGSRLQENRIGKIWNYLSLSRQIDELDKKRSSLSLW